MQDCHDGVWTLQVMSTISCIAAGQGKEYQIDSQDALGAKRTGKYQQDQYRGTSYRLDPFSGYSHCKFINSTRNFPFLAIRKSEPALHIQLTWWPLTFWEEGGANNELILMDHGHTYVYTRKTTRARKWGKHTHVRQILL